MSDQELINDWRPETRGLLRRLKAAGFEVVAVDDGDEGGKKKPKSENQAVALLINCDEAQLIVKHDNYPKTIWLYLVYGNEPGYLVCDYGVPTVRSVAELLDRVTTEHCDVWERKGQAKATREEIYGKAAR